jgi:phosphoribosylformimino-5-aminoimidazole carboxamide ribotide isomerase
VYQDRGRRSESHCQNALSNCAGQASPRPIPLSIALRDSLGPESLYLADLDAIAGDPLSVELYQELASLGVDLWIDAGLRNIGSAGHLLDLALPNLNAVIGLESISGPDGLATMIDWMTDDPIEIADRAISEGVERLIILELTRVGTGRGIGTHRLLSRLRDAYPEVEISVGGGISCIEEIQELRRAGASAVLVGSAIHDGRIGRREIEQIAMV